MSDPSTRPIFVIGTGRSGTSLLRLMLCAHPRIYVSHEASFYVWDNLLPRQRSGDEFLKYYFQTFSFRWLRLDPKQLLQELPRPLPRSETHLLFTTTMRILASRHGRERFGDKTPSHAANLGRIFTDYPDARVVRIVRDPRGVVRSLANMPWASASISANSGLCEMERRQVAPFVDRILQIRLEDLLDDPRATMGRVLEFVDEPWSDQVLEHAEHVADLDDMPPVPWFASAARPLGKPGANWSSYSPVQLRVIERLNRKTMEAFGYEKAELTPDPGRLAVLAGWLRDQPESLRFLYTFMRMGLRSRNAANFGSARSQALFARLNPRAWDRYPGLQIPEPPSLPAGWDSSLG